MIQIETKYFLKELKKYDVVAITLKPKERNIGGIYHDIIVYFMKNEIVDKKNFQVDISLNLDDNNFIYSLVKEFNLFMIGDNWMSYISEYGNIISHKNSIILVRKDLLSKIEFKLCLSYLLVSIFDNTLQAYYCMKVATKINLGDKDKLNKLFKNEEERRYGFMYLYLKFLKDRIKNETMNKIINTEIEYCKEFLNDDILLALELEEN